ncbi:MAG TPA: mycofactocin biosynthesis glycosyltransferase MftF [Acidimicrobiales bacterium]
MALPPGFRVALDPGVRRVDGGTVLIGGAPLRILRLTGGGSRAVDELAGGAPVGAGPGRQALARRLLDAGMAHPRPGPSAVSAADVTLVVPVRDRAEGLRATLAAAGHGGPVIVVDDGSAVAVAAPSVAPATVIRHDRSRGPAAARNSGWRAARTDLVAFVDADCEPAPGWLAGLLPHFGDPAVAAVAPRVTARPGVGAPRWLADYERVRSPLDRGPREGTVRPGSPVPYVPTAALVLRRSVLQELGGFDEDLTVGEDVDLVWRLVEAGWTVRYEPSVTVTHPTRSSLGAWVRQRVDYGSSAAPLRRRHGTAVAPAAMSGWTAGALGLAAGGRPVLGVAVAAGTTALLGPRLRALDHPGREALRLAGKGHLFAGARLAEAVRRAWWPLLAAMAGRSRRARLVLAAAFLVPGVARRPGAAVLGMVDDVAYSAGVWLGCVRERSAAALVPDLRTWPGRQPAVASPSTDTNETISPG